MQSSEDNLAPGQAENDPSLRELSDEEMLDRAINTQEHDPSGQDLGDVGVYSLSEDDLYNVSDKESPKSQSKNIEEEEEEEEPEVHELFEYGGTEDSLTSTFLHCQFIP